MDTGAWWPKTIGLHSQTQLSYFHFHIVQGFSLVNEAEVDVFLELSCFFDNPTDVGNLISGSYAFSKSSLNMCKFIVHILLRSGLENFDHYFASNVKLENCW